MKHQIKLLHPKKRDTLSGTVAGALTDTDTNEGLRSSQPRFTSKTILIRPKVNQYNQDRGREHFGRKPNEDSTTYGRKQEKGPSICGTESKLLSSPPLDGGQEDEGEGLGLDCMGASKREEQTELSLRARNRKAPASCISTLTVGELQSGIPACCYSECSLATGQQHQRQRPPGSQSLPTDSHQDTWRFSPLPQKRCRSTWRLQGVLQHSGEPSTMSTKFYKADRDLAFSKHYCPQADYLDVYNSSCRSLTQPSTVSDWSEDDISLQQSSVVSANIQSTTACSETGSFECIDVAMENQGEVYRGGTKTVPKRQIQLKRRNTAESQDSDKGEVTNEAQCTPSTASHRRDVFMRQHSTPATFHQESHGMESENRTAQAERKQRLQKSMSLDETSTKTKMASCIIKSVLSKKMQCELNLQNSEVNEGAFAPLEVQNNGKNCHQSPLAAKESNTTDMSSVDSHRQSHSIQYHQVASAKTHIKPLYKQNSISLVSSFGGSEFQSTSTKRAEIATTLESEEIERQNPRDGALPYANRSPGDRLSCDSAKGKTRSTCAGSSRSGGKQAPVKNTPEECNRGQGVHKQQNPLPKTLQRTDTLWGSQVSQQPLISEGVSGKAIETGDRGEVKFVGQSGNIGTQGIFKAKAPVHVVRDVRRLVKNTYNLSFKNTVLGQEDSLLSFYQQSAYDQVSHREACGVRAPGPNEKLFVKKVSPSAPLKVTDTASLYTTPKGYVTKATALHESRDRIPNIGFTNITPQSLAKSIEKRGNRPNINQSDNLGSNANISSKYPNRAEMLRQTWSSVEPPSKSNQQWCERTGTTNEKQKSPQATATNSFTLVPTYYSSAAHMYQPEQYQPSVTTCSSAKDSSQNQGPPPRSQGQTTLTCTPSPACVQLTTTGTPQPLMSPFFHTPNPMNYQTIQTHVGKMTFIQAPVLMQPPPQNQPVQLLRGEKFSPPQPAGNGENKMPSPDTQQQQYLCSTQGFMAPFSTEYRQGSAGSAYPEIAGGQVYGQGPRHMLMDPETGRCFYVDVPQLPPQRKMLFDPETCQYVEVLLPQQTVPTAVLPPACAMPYQSLQFPAMYPPKCFSVQAHPQEMPHTWL